MADLNDFDKVRHDVSAEEFDLRELVFELHRCHRLDVGGRERHFNTQPLEDAQHGDQALGQVCDLVAVLLEQFHAFGDRLSVRLRYWNRLEDGEAVLDLVNTLQRLGRRF